MSEKLRLAIEAAAVVAERERIRAAVEALPDASTASSGTPTRLVGHISRTAVLALLLGTRSVIDEGDEAP